MHKYLQQYTRDCIGISLPFYVFCGVYTAETKVTAMCKFAYLKPSLGTGGIPLPNMEHYGTICFLFMALSFII
jgi:hypothetical protein